MREGKFGSCSGTVAWPPCLWIRTLKKRREGEGDDRRVEDELEQRGGGEQTERCLRLKCREELKVS